MEFLVLNLESRLCIVRGKSVLVEVFDGVGVDETSGVDILLLLGPLCLFLLVPDEVLAFYEEGVDAFEIQLKELDKLQLICLPGGRVLMFELGKQVGVFALQQVFTDVRT